MAVAAPRVLWRESRRLTGPNLLLDGPGAVLEASCPVGREDELIGHWRRQALVMLQAVGWPDAEIASRRFLGGASLAVAAPLDGLYAATLVNEWACEAAAADLGARPMPALESAAASIRHEIASDRDPALLALAAAARAHDVACIVGDRRVSVGLGRGSDRWFDDDLPDPDAIDWASIHDVPLVLVTGTNGKSTTVRLLAAMARAAGRIVGLSSSDWVRVGDEILDRGDFSGPGGARMALRDRRVELAVLELARGGILRRGLPVARADAAIVTNVAADHLGEYGILDLDGVADAKLVVAKALRGGPLILNADDPRLVERAPGTGALVHWFTMAPAHGITDGAALEQGWLVLRRDGTATPVVPAAEVRIGMGGVARHNLANALAALAGASALRLPLAAMADALRSFGVEEADNPGRGVQREIGGVKVLVDFAHNPHGVAAIAQLVAAMPAMRRLVLLGQAGDRTDPEIRALAAAVWAMRPDRIILKEMDSYLRGRAPGEVPALLREELGRLGAPPEAVTAAESETEAVRGAFAWALAGDLLVLLSHAARARTLAFLDRLTEEGWRPGRPLPGS
ncbi:MAG: Mur ligase family protein [Geminicoccaceae bacterium]